MKRAEFQTALLELRSQALSNKVYREQFTRADGLVRETIARILRRGIEDSTFREIEVEETSELLASTISGVILQRSTGNREMTVRRVRDSLLNYMQSEILH